MTATTKVLYSRTEAAAYLGISVRLLDQKRRSGEILWKDMSGSGRVIRIEQSELDAYTERCGYGSF